MNSERSFNPDLRAPGFSRNNTELAYDKSIPDKKKKKRIDPLNFPKYDPEMVAADVARVQELEVIFDAKDNTPEKKEMKAFTDAAEYLLGNMIEDYDWMGSGTLMIRTSKYDDYVGGIDAVAEFQDAKHLGMALDFTINSAAVEKVGRIKREIDQGTIPEVRYFKSVNYKGELKVARIVITLDRTVIDDVMEKKLGEENAFRQMNSEEVDPSSRERYKMKRRESREALSTHPLQIDILRQIILQLNAYSDYAKSVAIRSPELAEASEKFVVLYEEVKRNILAIYNQKKEIVFDKKYLDQLSALRIRGEESILSLLDKM